MAPRHGIFIAVSLILVASSLLTAQSSTSKQVSPINPSRQIQKAQEVFAAYWTSEPGWDTELQMKNSLSTAPLTVTPVLRLASGEEILLDPVTIASNVSVSAWVNEGLLRHAPNLLNAPGSYGSVVFRFTSLNAMNLHAIAVSSMQGEPIAFAVKAHGVLGASLPGSLEGVWWQPRSGLKDVLAISNSSDRKIAGTLSLFDSNGKQWSQPLSLAPRQTQRMALGDLLLKTGLSGNYGGISLDVPTSAVDSVHFMYDETKQFSTSLEMFSRDPSATLQQRAGSDTRQWTMRAPMLALSTPDPTLGVTAGIVLQPTIFVRNTTAKKISADLALSWRSDSAKGQAKLPEMKLAPFATQQLQIGAMQKELGIPDDAHWALVSLTTNASPDDLIAIASSRDATGRYGFESRFTGGSGGHYAGGEWRYDANHNQLVSVTNSGQKPADALLTLHYDNGQKKYEMQQTIAPGDQMWVNLAHIIRQRVPDRKGNSLPVDVSTVTYDLQDLTPRSHSLTVSELAVDSTVGFTTIPPPCADCCGFSLTGFNPSVLDLGSGNTDTVAIDGVGTCNGDLTQLTFDFDVWGSDNTSVANMTYAKAQAVGPGSTTGFANGRINIGGACACNYVPEETYLPITVTPDHLVVKSDTTSVLCTTNATIRRIITYSEVDVNGNSVGTVSTEEQFASKGTNTCNTTIHTSQTCSPDAGGILQDAITVGCNSVGGSCGATFTKQQWLYCPPSGTPVPFATPGDLVIHNNSVTVGGYASFPTGAIINVNGITP